MNKTFKKRVFAGTVAALIMAGSTQIVGICSMADVSTGAARSTPNTDKNSRGYILDQFDYGTQAELKAVYELFDNWNDGTAPEFNGDGNVSNYDSIKSKFGTNSDRVTKGIDCDVDDGKFKFIYNLDSSTNLRSSNINGWNLGWANWDLNPDNAHCGFLRNEYTDTDTNKPDFSKFDGIEFDITGYGSCNSFVIQIGNVKDHGDDNQNVRFRYPVYLGFNGVKTIKVPFDVLQPSDESKSSMNLDETNRYSFYVNRSFDYNKAIGLDYNSLDNTKYKISSDGKTLVGKNNTYDTSNILIDNIRLYTNEEEQQLNGTYVKGGGTTTITYNGSDESLSGDTVFDVILARKIKNVTVSQKNADGTQTQVVNDLTFTNDQLNFNVSLDENALKEKCKELGNGEYLITFHFDDCTENNGITDLDNDLGNETDTINLSIKNIKGEHQHNYDESTWKHDETDHWHECITDDGTTCDAEIKPESKKPHNYGEWVTVSEPTESTAGSQKHVCTDCGYAQTKTIPAIGTGNDDPENGDSTPENGGSTPENGGSTPENGGSTPESGDSTPENGDSTPENGDSTLENGDSTPENTNNGSFGNTGGNPNMGITGELVPAAFAAACITLVMVRKNKK